MPTVQLYRHCLSRHTEYIVLHVPGYYSHKRNSIPTRDTQFLYRVLLSPILRAGPKMAAVGGQ